MPLGGIALYKPSLPFLSCCFILFDKRVAAVAASLKTCPPVMRQVVKCGGGVLLSVPYNQEHEENNSSLSTKGYHF